MPRMMRAFGWAALCVLALTLVPRRRPRRRAPGRRTSRACRARSIASSRSWRTSAS